MREELQKILNFASSSNGEVKTYFNGRVTQSQLIVGIICLVAILFVLAFVKRLVKILCIVGITCVCLVYFGLASPAQISDVASQVSKTGISYYQKIASASENVKITDNSIAVKINDNWVNVEDIQGVVSGADNVTTVILNGESYTTDDKNVIEVLRTFTN